MEERRGNELAWFDERTSYCDGCGYVFGLFNQYSSKKIEAACGKPDGNFMYANDFTCGHWVPPNQQRFNAVVRELEKQQKGKIWGHILK